MDNLRGKVNEEERVRKGEGESSKIMSQPGWFVILFGSYDFKKIN